jgi:hypothetical protein
MRTAPPISTDHSSSKRTESAKTPREHFTRNTETASGKFEHKERTLEQAGFGRNQHVHPDDNIAAQTPLLSPAEIWRR